MANLPTDPAERLTAILGAVVEKLDVLPDSGFVYGRKRYVEGEKGENGYEDQFCITNGAGESRVRYIEVLLVDIYTSKDAPGRSRRTHYVFQIDITYQFEDTRPDEGAGDNSTVGFNALLARAEESFGADITLGFNEADNAQIESGGLSSIERADVQPVDGTLCHTKGYSLEVTTLAC